MNVALDVPLLRSDTPGVANVLHFNNAGAALPPRPVLDGVTGHLARASSPRGPSTCRTFSRFCR
jgi:cysteine desulfurase/selenocysteine lyase